MTGVRRARCKGCGNEFTAARADADYCSPACKQKAYRSRNASPVTVKQSTSADSGNALPVTAARGGLASQLDLLAEAFADLRELVDSDDYQGDADEALLNWIEEDFGIDGIRRLPELLREAARIILNEPK